MAVELGIAERLGLHEDHLYRLMRMLASLGIFEETGERCFRNSRLSHRLRSDHPESVRAMVLIHNSPAMTEAWCDSLGPAIRTGEVPLVLSHGEDLFAYLDHHLQEQREHAGWAEQRGPTSAK